MFLDFKSAFDSVNRSSLFSTLTLRGVPTKYINLMKALYAETSGRVRVYGHLSDSFPTTSGVRQGCPLSPFLFNFVVDMIMDITLQGLDDAGVEYFPVENLTDLDYADDIVLLFDLHDSAQSALDKMAEVTASFGMFFAPQNLWLLPKIFGHRSLH